jgi:hypothetical protein
VQFLDKVLDSEVSTKFGTIGIMVMVDTKCVLRRSSIWMIWVAYLSVSRLTCKSR